MGLDIYIEEPWIHEWYLKPLYWMRSPGNIGGEHPKLTHEGRGGEKAKRLEKTKEGKICKNVVSLKCKGRIF